MPKVQVTTPIGLVVAFVLQVFFGSIGFFLVYIVAVALSVGIHLLNKMATESAPWLTIAAPYVEIGLFCADLIAFALFVASEVLKLARALLQEWNASDD